MKHKNSAVNEKRFQQILRQFRKERGLSQAALAASLGKPQSFVSKYETGERLLSCVEVIDVCHALCVNPQKLLKEYLSIHET